MMFERISAITLKVTDMARSVHFYNEILGLQLIYGGKHSAFTSLRTAGAKDAILNLEQGACSNGWGRIIFHVKDVDELWGYITAKGLDAPRPRDAGWGERYFHLHDPDGHELSFAKPATLIYGSCVVRYPRRSAFPTVPMAPLGSSENRRRLRRKCFRDISNGSQGWALRATL